MFAQVNQRAVTIHYTPYTMPAANPHLRKSSRYRQTAAVDVRCTIAACQLQHRGALYYWLSLAVIAGLVTVLMQLTTAVAQAQEDPVPLPPHCIGAGPVPLNEPDFCGCTWGAVYYRGQAVTAAPVTLTFGGQQTVSQTRQQVANDPPLYHISGSSLGAKKNDTMTVTVTFAGQTVTRAFRAWPDTEGEQELPLVLPEQGVWTSWNNGDYTQALAAVGDTIWAGGAAGLLAVNVVTNAQTPHTLPWSDQTVIAIAVATNGEVWVAGPHNLARYKNNQWLNVTPPFAAKIRTLAADPTNSNIWVGGGDGSDALAKYDGAWHTVTALDGPVATLVVDKTGTIWAGTLGNGLYAHAATGNINSGWLHYQTENGLASDYVLSSAADAQGVWFGTRPYLSGEGPRGGITHYQFADDSWQTYTTTHGLPADSTFPDAPAPIYALTVDAQGRPLAGTPKGVYLQGAPTQWVSDLAATDDVNAVIQSGHYIVAARQSALWRLDRTVTPGTAPMVTITGPANRNISQAETLTLHASATDTDNIQQGGASQILAWDWQSDRVGSLCTTANTCVLPAGILPLGKHVITVRVQEIGRAHV